MLTDEDAIEEKIPDIVGDGIAVADEDHRKAGCAAANRHLIAQDAVAALGRDDSRALARAGSERPSRRQAGQLHQRPSGHRLNSRSG